MSVGLSNIPEAEEDEEESLKGSSLTLNVSTSASGKVSPAGVQQIIYDEGVPVRVEQTLSPVDQGSRENRLSVGDREPRKRRSGALSQVPEESHLFSVEVDQPKAFTTPTPPPESVAHLNQTLGSVERQKHEAQDSNPVKVGSTIKIPQIVIHDCCSDLGDDDQQEEDDEPAAPSSQRTSQDTSYEIPSDQGGHRDSSDQEFYELSSVSSEDATAEFKALSPNQQLADCPQPASSIVLVKADVHRASYDEGDLSIGMHDAKQQCDRRGDNDVVGLELKTFITSSSTSSESTVGDSDIVMV
jgi:hypothetical protein